MNHPGSNLTKGTRKGRKGMDDGLDEVIPPSSLMEEHGINIFAKGEMRPGPDPGSEAGR